MDLNYAGFNIFVFFAVCADDPNNDPKVSGDPYKTLFVARLVSVLLIICKFYCLWFTLCSGVFFFLLQNYETTESKIKRELESYGPIKQVGIFEHTHEGLVRGYAATFSLTCHAKNLFILFKISLLKVYELCFYLFQFFQTNKKMVGNENCPMCTFLYLICSSNYKSALTCLLLGKLFFETIFNRASTWW